jgi:hypothetical protein
MAKSRLQRLRDQGFDLSEYDPSDQTWDVQCSQCVALAINGYACHETGCPNQRKAKDEEV